MEQQQCEPQRLKAAASLQVIFLDSDNIAVADPASLFDSEEYQSSGALLWPDYWGSSAAPDLARILDVQELPKGTFESGQMVFDKQRSAALLILFHMPNHFSFVS